MAFMNSGEFLVLLARDRPHVEKLSGALDLPMIRLDHRPHREVLHLRFSQFVAEDNRQSLAAPYRRSQFHRHLAHDAANKGVDLAIAVGVRRDRSRYGEY